MTVNYVASSVTHHSRDHRECIYYGIMNRSKLTMKVSRVQIANPFWWTDTSCLKGETGRGLLGALCVALQHTVSNLPAIVARTHFIKLMPGLTLIFTSLTELSLGNDSLRIVFTLRKEERKEELC